MKQFNQSILDVIGNTPIVRLNSVAKDVSSDIYVKLEYLNPGGSIKDKIGLHMCKKALERGDIKPGGTIIEGTSGNTGVGIAMFCAIHGLKAVFVMADKQSKEKMDNLRAYGATVIVCPTDVKPEDPRSYYSVSAMLPKIIPNSLYLNQYANLDNTESHYLMTGPEIYEQTKGEFDVFMTAVGTGGTISGTGKYLKEKMPQLKVVGVDCEGSILDHYHRTGEMGEARNYVLEGIGEDFIPDNINFDIIDEFVVAGDEESFHMTRDLLKKEGIYTGGSAGAAVIGAIKYAKKQTEPKRILVILHDSGNRYSSKIFNDEWMIKMGYLPSDHSNKQEAEIYAALKNAGVNL